MCAIPQLVSVPLNPIPIVDILGGATHKVSTVTVTSVFVRPFLRYLDKLTLLANIFVNQDPMKTQNHPCTEFSFFPFSPKLLASGERNAKNTNPVNLGL